MFVDLSHNRLIFNFTKNHQFSTRIELKTENNEIVTKTKLLGTILTNDLKWYENTKHIVKKTWSRMQLLRKVLTFSVPLQQKLDIYKKNVRSHLEQSCSVWNSGLAIGNEKDLERVQKSAVRQLLGPKYTTNEAALKILNIHFEEEKREILCAKFAFKTLRHEKVKSMFKPNMKNHMNKKIK